MILDTNGSNQTVAVFFVVFVVFVVAIKTDAPESGFPKVIKSTMQTLIEFILVPVVIAVIRISCFCQESTIVLPKVIASSGNASPSYYAIFVHV